MRLIEKEEDKNLYFGCDVHAKPSYEELPYQITQRIWFDLRLGIFHQIQYYEIKGHLKDPS